MLDSAMVMTAASDDCNLQDLLQGQFEVLQKALAFHQAIVIHTSSISHGSSIASQAPRSPSKVERGEFGSPSKVERQEFGSPSKASFKEPLLGHHKELAARAALQEASRRVVNGSQQAPEMEDLRHQALLIRGRCRDAAARLLPSKEAIAESVSRRSTSTSPLKKSSTTVRLIEQNAKKQVKQHLAEANNKPVVTEEEYYKTEGPWQALARSNTFKNLTVAMILFSTFWVAIDTDYNKAPTLLEAPLVFQVVDNIVCLYFSVEIFVRLMSFSRMSDAFKQLAFNFDLFLVLLMVEETWIQALMYEFSDYHKEHRSGLDHVSSSLRALRLLRITRAFRMSRLFRAVPELMILVNGIQMAIRSVCTTLILLVLLTYTFAVATKELLQGSPAAQGNFDSVPAATNYLLLQVICGWDVSFLTSVMGQAPFCYAILLTYVMIASLTIMNMLTGVMVDVVATTAEIEEDEQNMKALTQDIADIICLTDENGDNTVTAEEFGRLLKSPSAVKKLYEGGVNVLALADYADFLFRDTSELSLEDFTEVVLEFRGSNQATTKDMVDLRVFVSKELARLDYAANMLPKV